MPYSVPGGSPVPAEPRPARRRARSSGTYFSDERGPGAFVSLGSLPKRTKPGFKKTPVFHFNDEDDHDNSNSNSISDDDDDHLPPMLTRKTNDTFKLSLDVDNLSPTVHLPAPSAVPFPQSSPVSPFEYTPPIPGPIATTQSPLPITPIATPPSRSPRPSISRYQSSPQILLSNGKPLKSSLKSSSSAPAIFPEGSNKPIHMRAQSAPTTPFLHGPKNVHFAEKESGLETVKVFSRSARPASLSNQNGDDTETETEPESSQHIRSGAYLDSFPFPRLPVSSSSPLSAVQSFELDDRSTSAIPSPSPPSYANIHMETLTLSVPPATSSSSSRTAPVLTGSLVVRNVAYEKHVAVRFTLDEWQTTSEVLARHVVSLQSLPPGLQPRTVGDAISAISSESSALWDRFAFTIRLEDYTHKLHEKVLWLVARYSTGAGNGEWWDNNGGRNYKVGFRIRREGHNVGGVGMRRNAVSAPPPLTIPVPPPPRKVSPPLQSPSPPSQNSSLPPATPPPDSPIARRNSLLVATTNRLSKFTLANYASPSTKAPIRIPYSSVTQGHGVLTPPASPEDESTQSWSKEGTHSQAPTVVPPPKNINKQQMINGHPATASPVGYGYGVGGPVAHGDDGLPRSHQGLSLHWPWGTRSAASSHLSDSAKEDAVSDEYDRAIIMSPTSGSPPQQPRSLALPLGNSSPPRSGNDSDDSSPSPTRSGSVSPPNPPTPPKYRSSKYSPPISSPKSTSPSSSGSSTPLDNDPLYKEFIKKWCFAQSPSPGTGGGPVGVSISPPGLTIGSVV